MPLYATSDQDVHSLGINQIWDRQTVLIKTKEKRKKTVRSGDAFFYHSQLKRPLIFCTRGLHSLSVFTRVTQTD